MDRRRKHKGNELTPVFCWRVTPRDEPSELGLGVAHFQFAQSLSGKWKVVRCAHALPGINIKAQKWRYTAPSCTPVSPIHRRFNITALRLYRSKFWETCAGRRPHFHGLSCEPQGGYKTHMGSIKRKFEQISPLCLVNAVAGAASSLQYCSVRSLMADVS